MAGGSDMRYWHLSQDLLCGLATSGTAKLSSLAPLSSSMSPLLSLQARITAT